MGVITKKAPFAFYGIFYLSGKNRSGRKKKMYLISFDQLEELLLAAQTPQGNVARKAVLAVKKAVFKYIKLEGERAQQELEESMSQLAIKDEEHTAQLALAEQEKAALATQLKNLREAKSYLYAFHLFDNRYIFFRLIAEKENAQKSAAFFWQVRHH